MFSKGKKDIFTSYSRSFNNKHISVYVFQYLSLHFHQIQHKKQVIKHKQ